MSGRNSHVILVHGAWADGSSWAKVITRLANRNVDATAVPLPLTSLSDDVAALERSIGRIEGPVVVVGHAYAGAVIGQSQNEKVKALVYVAALAPDEGETVADVFYRDEPHPLAPALAPDPDGLIWLPEDAFAAAFAPDACVNEQRVLAAIQRPISARCIGVAVQKPLWKSRPSWFLIAEQDRMINAATQRFMADRMGAATRAYAVDHTPSVTAPDTVADMIFSAVDAVCAG